MQGNGIAVGNRTGNKEGIMTNYQRNLTQRLLKGQLDDKNIENIEHEFIELIENLGFVFDYRREEEDIERYKLFKYRPADNIYLMVVTDTSFYEDEQTPPDTSWGTWHICDSIGSILFYTSPYDETNLTVMEGDVTGCNGFWLEGTDQIPKFIEKYRSKSQI